MMKDPWRLNVAIVRRDATTVTFQCGDMDAVRERVAAMLPDTFYRLCGADLVFVGIEAPVAERMFGGAAPAGHLLLHAVPVAMVAATTHWPGLGWPELAAPQAATAPAPPVVPVAAPVAPVAATGLHGRLQAAAASDAYGDKDLACPGCGCMPGDGVTAGCTHEDGCGYFADDKLADPRD